MATFIALLAAVGVGTIIAALVAHITAISNHRQQWINALRDDVAEYIRRLEKLNYVMIEWCKDSEKTEQKKREARTDVLFIYERIRLRLNKSETEHRELEKKLRDFLDQPLGEALAGRTKINETIELAREVLKREWEATKYPWRRSYRRLRQPLVSALHLVRLHRQ